MTKNKVKAIKNKLILSLLLLVFAGPLTLASLFYLNRENITFKTVENGHFISPPIAAQSLAFFKSDYLGKWQLIYVSPPECELDCQNPLDTLKKIHLATGNEQNRVEYRIISSSLIPDLKAGQYGIIDPQGWLILQYSNPANPIGILKDLKRLLRLSHVG